MSKEKNIGVPKWVKDSLSNSFQQDGKELVYIVPVKKTALGRFFGTVNQDGIEIFEATNKKELNKVDELFFRDWESASAEHFFIKAQFIFQKDLFSKELIVEDKAKEIEAIIRQHVPVQVTQRPWWRKVVGFRSKTKWKMVVASIAYLYIFALAAEFFSENKKDNVQTAASSVQQEENAQNTRAMAQEKNEETPTPPPPAQEKQEEVKAPALLTRSGGLGDTYQAFEKQYGENAGTKDMARFSGDYILPMFVNDRAWNVLVQFEATDKPRRTLEDANSYVQNVIPLDSKKIKKWKLDGNRDVVMYHSPSLANLFDQQWFGEEKPGTFIVILKHDENGIFSFTVATGNNP
ncbi:hypothetical protein [Aneurinibacillus migulanus]|uniref:Uncharacterized protein n=1 Tax=Aneurinibacillus migulanus TaxID=47500 RepID=A0A0D1Y1B2_ANEMI|nr:hypothetical protein [Aneurinibacillus migulanus]KIV60326.1 hypothetical protein TS65_00695 [Aneurinibacillus migulanus]KON90474.1 hypothetical protein AF333_28720 [Aneurinibacillus migulanus]MED0894961.1 hypothetical protein [Aneurinibacillus migulanus]MED1614396.1 hypothetical protein [Aneurinibacillus migulanus]SDJ79008.1 hypothetical protein SAMN04487909_12892 [Aneurinibacillus migulanus]